MKKILKISLSALLVMLLAFSFAACGEDEKLDLGYKEFDVEAMENDLRNSVKYEAKLPEKSLGSSVLAVHFPTLPKNDKGEVYAQGDFWVGDDVATADLIMLIKGNNEKEGTELFEWAEAHKQSLIETYSDYDPEEVKKIENAVIRQNGKIVVFVITNDYKTAQGVVDKYWN